MQNIHVEVTVSRDKYVHTFFRDLVVPLSHLSTPGMSALSKPAKLECDNKRFINTKPNKKKD